MVLIEGQIEEGVCMTISEPKSESLRVMYWRDEILQVMFWLKGEGFGDQVDAPLLERFLGVDSAIGIQYLDRLVEEDLLMPHEDRFELTEKGRRMGAQIFTDEFSEMTKSAHGECGADCWCHSSPEEAEACAHARLDPHDHPH